MCNRGTHNEDGSTSDSAGDIEVVVAAVIQTIGAIEELKFRHDGSQLDHNSCITTWVITIVGVNYRAINLG